MTFAAEIIVHGIVQGVGYRYFCLQKANELNLIGWVKNNNSGSVELLVEGAQDSITDFIALLNEGPISSKVSNVAVSYRDVSGGFLEFEVRH